MQKVELTSKLVVAIIGLAAVSAILIPTYAVPTIRSADIFDETILSRDIKNGEVTADDIKDATIQEEDIADGVIQSGGTELNIHRVAGVAVTIPVGEARGINVSCPDDEFLTGGGYDGPTNYVVYNNYPTSAHNWFVAAINPGGGAFGINAFALCLDPTP